ncbi:MAG: YgeY family selenium metabolism-linked hydrolase [Anaerolineae bacterium]|nr:YgeY family selenium metabolism-linked hydrolase [Anaerolineae bacterium]MDK1080388.1 YgeY family selenium metabolism-linked hydrolase [Anaerolineae bacterium]MDK1119554.1 YgeY family selenium metabolism-linked hydrolase [Anaerolineae bacterium]
MHSDTSSVYPIEAIKRQVEQSRDDIIQFLQDICAIPSMEGQIKEVGDRIGDEMTKLGFDEVRFDEMGNILGRIGNGKRIIVYDSHIDTVGIGDPTTWDWDPFIGKIEDGELFARGACDEKGSTPGMVYGLALAKDLGFLEDTTVYYFGNMEESCDGIAPRTFVEIDPGLRPDFVVIGEPTIMQIYRGHKGRVELKVTSKGKSAHAASHHLGDSALYKLIPVISGIRDLDAHLHTDSFLGKGTIMVTDAKVSTASINAVPDGFTIFIDRRLTFGETKEEAIQQIKDLIPGYLRGAIKVEEMLYDAPSYTGFVLPVEKYFPAWAIDSTHLIVQSGQETIRRLWSNVHPTGKWSFSTNGTYWAGVAGIPSIGFGPGDERYAHTVEDRVSLNEVVDAVKFYTLFPKVLSEKILKE